MSTAVPRDIEAAREVERAVLDYYEAWFEADGDRMKRALHRDLVKRKAGETLDILTAARMIELTTQGEGKADADKVEITIDDLNEDIASVTVCAGPYYEYLHLVRTRDGWKIANALWRPR